MLQHKEEYRNALFSRWFVALAAWNEEIMRDPAVTPPPAAFWARILVNSPQWCAYEPSVSKHSGPAQIKRTCHREVAHADVYSTSRCLLTSKPA